MRSHTFQGKAKLPPGRACMTTRGRYPRLHVCIDNRRTLVQRLFRGCGAARDFYMTVPAVLCASALKEMKYASQNFCDKTIDDDEIALYRNCLFSVLYTIMERRVAFPGVYIVF